MATFRGSCLCGEVAFEVDGPFDCFVNCHCSRCRKATGTAHSCEVIVKASALRWLRGEASVVRFDLPAAANFMALITSGSMDARNCFLVPSGAFRPGFPAAFFSAITLPVRCARPQTIPSVVGRGKPVRPATSLFPPPNRRFFIDPKTEHPTEIAAISPRRKVCS
ncbi:GFA family protein [Bradyrhizobium arachidis]